MTERCYHLRGTLHDLSTVAAELRELPYVSSVREEAPATPVASNFLDRPEQRQHEIYEVIFAIVLNLAASAAWDGIKLAVQATLKRRSVTLISDGEETPVDDIASLDSAAEKPLPNGEAK